MKFTLKTVHGTNQYRAMRVNDIASKTGRLWHARNASLWVSLSNHYTI